MVASRDAQRVLSLRNGFEMKVTARIGLRRHTERLKDNTRVRVIGLANQTDAAINSFCGVIDAVRTRGDVAHLTRSDHVLTARTAIRIAGISTAARARRR